MFNRTSLVALLFAMLPVAAHAETDPRDYAGVATLPSRTSLFLGYYRHVSSADTQSFSQDVAIFRGVYLLKAGGLTIVPVDFFIPVADVTAYAPIPGGGGAEAAIHTSGVGDLTYLPTLIYEVPESPGNSSFLGASFYVTAPVGSYNAANLISVGTNRWSFKPELALAQRFLARFTFEILGNVTFFTDNTDFVAGRTQLTLAQKPTFGLETHLMADMTEFLELGLSYYVFANGRSFIGENDTTVAPESTVQTLRGTVGLRIEKRTIVYLQYNQDLSAGGEGSVSRFWGGRIVHAF
jgi:hypothetical protein